VGDPQLPLILGPKYGILKRMIIDVAKVLLPSAAAFCIGLAITPLITNFLYKHKMWKKTPGKKAIGGADASEFNRLHGEREVKAPKMGGMVIWLSALLTMGLFRLLAELWPSDITSKLEFLSRNQTWLPLFTLMAGSIIGLVDDFLDVKGGSDKSLVGGLSLGKRLSVVALTGLIGGWWFFDKLDVTSIMVPFVGELFVGALVIPLFVFAILGIYSGGVIDGIDGLAGGVFAAIFAAYGGIAFFQNQIDLAAFCAVIVGGILAFLWFNIPPARFYMSETGTMGLTMSLAVVAFLTKAVLVLPIIAAPLVATTASDIIQVVSKKLRGKKVFRIAPLHHHFEAIGWPDYKVTMRYWVLSFVFAIIGMIVALVGNAI
jgi:phospho-N-acetylmuramoyl-pentapeptide-transferase